MDGSDDDKDFKQSILLFLMAALLFLKNQRLIVRTRNFYDYNIDVYRIILILECLQSDDRERYIFPRSAHRADVLFSSSWFTDSHYMSTFRMSSASFFKLHDLLRPHIEKQVTQSRKPLPSERRLAIFLYHVGLGASYTVISNQFGCGKSEVSGIIGGVAQAILFQLGEKYTRFSTIADAMRSMDFWRAKSGIPGVAACIDCSHIPIIKPSGSGVSYYNHKGFYSINVQVAVDHRKRFVDLVVGWPGSVGERRIWNNSGLNAQLEQFLSVLPPIYVSTRATNTSPVQQEAVQAFILSDSTYSSTSRMVPTFKTAECNQCPITKKLNFKLESIRHSIENAFGLCKGRFRLLNCPLESAKDDIVGTIKLIGAIFILHNFLIDVQDDMDIEPEEEANHHETCGEVDGEDEDINELESDDEQNEGPETRAILLRHMRWLETC